MKTSTQKTQPVQNSTKSIKSSKPSAIQTSKRLSNFNKLTAYDFAQARAQFFTDTLNEIYACKVKETVKSFIKPLKHKENFQYVKTDALFEAVCADVLEAKYKNIKRAEEAGFVNACGYDIFDDTNGIYLEMKEVAVSQRGGASPVLSAMVGNVKNKFCTLIVLVIDPYLSGEKKYQLYAIPPHAVADDASDSIGIPHHKIDRTGKYELVEQQENIGGAYAEYKIDSLTDLLPDEMFDRIRNVNVRKLVKVIRTLRGDHASESQTQELAHLDLLFTNCTKNNTKKKLAKGVQKVSGDITDKSYTIKKGVDRIFFKQNRLAFVAAAEAQDKS